MVSDKVVPATVDSHVMSPRAIVSNEPVLSPSTKSEKEVLVFKAPMLTETPVL